MLEEQLEIDISNLIKAFKNRGYKPTGFIRLINQDGYLKAIKCLIGNPKIHDAFNHMCSYGIPLTESLEYFINENTKYHELFTKEELEVCKSKLRQLGLL